MKPAMTVALTLGAVGVVGAAGGVAYALSRKGTGSSKPAPAPAPAPTPAPAPSSPSAPAPAPNAPVTNADLTAQLEAQRIAQEKAAAEQRRLQRVSTLQMSAANIENQQILILAQIDAVNRDSAPLNDFIQRAFDELVNSARFDTMARDCVEIVKRNCGFDLFGACNGANQPVCWNKTPDYGFGNPAAMLMNEARSTLGPQRLTAWRADQRRPLEADLARLEGQYQGVLGELKSLGASYQPQRADIHK